jgi:DNA-binding NarL/FixJ family response regulator
MAKPGGFMATAPHISHTFTIMAVTGSYLIQLGLEKALEEDRRIKLIGECFLGAKLEGRLAEERPHMVIIDTDTEQDVLDLIRQIKNRNLGTKILLLTGFEDKERTRKVLDQGVDGVILKIQPPAVVLAIVQTLMCQTNSKEAQLERSASLLGDKHATHSSIPATPPIKWSGSLTERERQIMVLVGQGLSNKDIADRLCISAITVRHHLTSIFDKVGVSNRQKLLIHAHGLGAQSS